ncbi:MAG TPA: allantoate amidohydrolase [Acidobacteriaceae bacterium]|jgi:allantoate deiminase|nr:allantoate amidohydrolase [Acidobacteriaceae bacterium]
MTESTSFEPSLLRARAAEAIAECRLIAAMTEQPGQITRRFLTPPVAEVHAHLKARMAALGMSVSVDAVGNLRGLWQPTASDGKRLILGSHIDTVPDAGAFDGVLGVVLALEWVRIAQELDLQRPIEVIAFSEEEGVRYGVPFLGSMAVAGIFDLGMLALEDADGVRMDDAIRAFGLNAVEIPQAALGDDVLGFVEIHIEQGPVLEAENLPLAVVEGIVGQSRLSFRFSGQANHAGTTPMHLRRDAMAAAAEWMIAVEAAAREEDGLVATVGKVSVQPNAGNVIPGVVELSLDVRHMSNRIRISHVKLLTRLASTIAHRRRVEVEWVQKLDEHTVHMDRMLSADLAAAVEAAGFPVRRLPSGAGHDAMVMATRVPTAMLFLRSPGGISHNPAETVLEEDVEAALKTGEFFLR